MSGHVVVAGAGPGGLATAAILRRSGWRVTLVERGAGPGANWRERYDGLRLNTVRWLSNLPGYRMPRSYGRWVSRDDFVAYLEDYSDRNDLPVETETEMLELHRETNGWLVRTTKGELNADAVAMATGAFDEPVVPAWPGLHGYRGSFQHVSTYRNAQPFQGQSVLVVGGGASGLEVALQLTDGGARRVDLAIRSGVHLFPRQIGPVPLTPQAVSRFLPSPVLDVFGGLMRAALPGDWPAPLPRPRFGLGAGLRAGTEPVVADGVVEALRLGRIRIVAAVRRFGSDTVELADGSTKQPDAVIAATGYRSRLPQLVGDLGVLDANGWPRHGDGRADPRIPGLAFVGFQAALTGRLPQMANQARRAARALGNG